uniref:G domain-containing protein n=1 Tax=Neogobius melanostomus TaxID=47308 RepID=A0A8C6T8M9_9GOBI
ERTTKTRRRGLERQLQALKTLVQEPDQDQDQDQDQESVPSLSRTRPGQNQNRLVSSRPCSGCGALLQAMDPVIPGFMPRHHLQTLLNPDQDRALEQTLCQRCHVLTHQRHLLEVQLDQDFDFVQISSRLRSSRALVLLVVDLLDLPSSIVPDLQDLIGTNKQVVVVGTKLDLLPVLTPSDLSSVKRRLCDSVGAMTRLQPLHVGVVSAKTGFGTQGDVVLLGSTNAGKSTLFNALLESDYNRLSGSNQRATESPWPGTTLNLLKFPILNPTPARLQRRLQRLREEQRLKEEDQTTESAVPERDRRGKDHGRPAYVSGESELFHSSFQTSTLTTRVEQKVQEELPPHELKDAHWFYDTPGIIRDNDMLALLTEQEVRAVVPVQALVPRTFVLKPGSALFIGKSPGSTSSGPRSVWFSVLVSALLPLHVSAVERAESVYEKHAGGRLLGVKLLTRYRHATDTPLTRRSQSEAAADINISSTGWVAVTPPLGDVIQLRVAPALLPRVVMLRGARIRKSSAYKPRKPPATPLSLSSQSRGGKTRK